MPKGHKQERKHIFKLMFHLRTGAVELSNKSNAKYNKEKYKLLEHIDVR